MSDETTNKLSVAQMILGFFVVLASAVFSIGGMMMNSGAALEKIDSVIAEVASLKDDVDAIKSNVNNKYNQVRDVNTNQNSIIQRIDSDLSHHIDLQKRDFAPMRDRVDELENTVKRLNHTLSRMKDRYKK